MDYNKLSTSCEDGDELDNISLKEEKEIPNTPTIPNPTNTKINFETIESLLSQFQEELKLSYDFLAKERGEVPGMTQQPFLQNQTKSFQPVYTFGNLKDENKRVKLQPPKNQNNQYKSVIENMKISLNVLRKKNLELNRQLNEEKSKIVEIVNEFKLQKENLIEKYERDIREMKYYHF